MTSANGGGLLHRYKRSIYPFGSYRFSVVYNTLDADINYIVRATRNEGISHAGRDKTDLYVQNMVSTGATTQELL